MRRNTASHAVGDSIYQALPMFMLRAPLLPVESYLSLSHRHYTRQGREGPSIEPAGLEPMISDALVLRALAVGSMDLYEALCRGEISRSVQRKLLRYVIRMSTRATPYGLFAGAGLGVFGDETTLHLGPHCHVVRSRIDMGVLFSLVFALEVRPGVREQLMYRSSDSIHMISGRVHSISRAQVMGKVGGHHPVSMRATTIIVELLELARQPVPYSILAQAVTSAASSSPDKADRLLNQLVDAGLLITDLRPPLTISSPAQYVIDRLKGIRAASGERQLLVDALEVLQRWDASPMASGAAELKPLVHAISAIRPLRSSARDDVLQVDMGYDLAGGTLNADVGLEAARAGELLLRLSPYPDGPPYLHVYKERFRSRYGEAARVPLLDLLDVEAGLGLPWAQAGPPEGAFHSQSARSISRQVALRELAFDAIRRGQGSVELSDEVIRKLSLWDFSLDRLPFSLDISISVAASHAASIDNGDFSVIVNPLAGAIGAGRFIGRFADMLGTDAHRILAAAAAADGISEHRLPVEISYIPSHVRLANVAVRPSFHLYRITEGIIDPSPNMVLINELEVMLYDGRLAVYWPRMAVFVAGREGHMLNSMQAPPACRAIIEFSNDRHVGISGFDWGAISNFPFLPRVTRGRLVLAQAQWYWAAEKNECSDREFLGTLERWRKRWEVPRHVFMAAGDNRLLIDLDDASQAGELRRELWAQGAVRLQEASPGPHQAWVKGSGGSHASEVIVSLTRNGARAAPAQVATAASTHRVFGVAQAQRLKGLGSDWLFIKLYCEGGAQDELLKGPIRDFSDQIAVGGGLADQWFYVRYADPKPHIRLRFHGMPPILLQGLLPALCSRAASLMDDGLCEAFELGVYERETDRYGGLEGMAVVESFFHADSVACGEMLSWIGRTDRLELGILNAESLLSAFGLGIVAREAWYGQRSADEHASSMAYRASKVLLDGLVRCGATSGGLTVDAPLREILRARRQRIESLMGSLRSLESQGRLTRPLADISVSVLHMSHNRLFGQLGPPEKHIYALLRRILRSIYARRLVFQPGAPGFSCGGAGA
jgi:thiopeptide-type bacteriocin biosynthesis protein